MAMRVLGEPIHVPDESTEAVDHKGWPYFHLNSLFGAMIQHHTRLGVGQKSIDGWVGTGMVLTQLPRWCTDHTESQGMMVQCLWNKWFQGSFKMPLGGVEGQRKVTKVVHIGNLRGFGVQRTSGECRFEVNCWS